MGLKLQKTESLAGLGAILCSGRAPDILTGQPAGLGKPGDLYIIEDTRERGRKDLDELNALKKFGVRKYDGENSAVESENGVILFPVVDLHFNTKDFQNRENEYSETSVSRILDAVMDGDFDWSVFDAITIWKNPDDQKFYVLSGHSRSEAFRRLALQNATVGGRSFDKIPAKIFHGTFEQAKELALNSNTLSTKESDLERAQYYRDRYAKFISQGDKPGTARKRITEQAQRNEGKNALKIVSLSFLNPDGLTADALRSLINAPTQDKERMTVAAEWIGYIMMNFPQLTAMHENELYRYLITGGHYGKEIRNKKDLAKRIQTAIEKNTEYGVFAADKSLNLERNLGKSYAEKQYDTELARLKAEAERASTLYQQKLAEFRTRQKQDSSITDAQILEAVRKYEELAKLAQADYLAFRDRRSDYLKADVAQQTLFGIWSDDDDDEPDSLGAYGDTYIFTDLRKRGKKEPGDCKALQTKNFTITPQTKAPRNYNPDITENTPGYKKARFIYQDDSLIYLVIYSSDIPQKIKVENPKLDKIFNWTPTDYSDYNRTGIMEAAYYQAIIDKWIPGAFDSYIYAKGFGGKLQDEKHRKELAQYFIKKILPTASEDLQKQIQEKYKKEFYKRYQTPQPEPQPEPEANNENREASAEVKRIAKELENEPEPTAEPQPEPDIENEEVEEASAADISDYLQKYAKLLDLQKKATDAWRWSSFEPEKMARYDIEGWQKLLDTCLAKIPDKYKPKFIERFRRKVEEIIAANSRTFSWSVTGRGGLTAKQMRQNSERTRREMELRSNLSEWADYYVRKILSRAERERKMQMSADELADERFNELLKDISIIQRAGNTYTRNLVKAEFLAKVEREAEKGRVELIDKVLEYLKPLNLFTARASIWGLAQYARNQREKLQSGGAFPEYQGVKVEADENENRLKLLFDNIPDEDMRKTLKSNGFRWSPRNKAWQRQLTANAVYVAKRILEPYKVAANLGKPTIKFEFESNDDLKAFLQENKETLIDSYEEADWSEANGRKALQGLKPAEYFNPPESELKCQGMKPTYRRLADYSALIARSENTDTHNGNGFMETLPVLRQMVRESMPQVKALARHLKADTLKQSCFNVWHWLHTNIRYQYDEKNKEQVRTAARSFADRNRGVDCDCLSVFTYALLASMGYDPKFEIVAFNYNEAFGHIYVICDNIVIDRVMDTFNKRPAFITKTMHMEIPVYELRGVCDSKKALHGLYNNLLKKIQTGTATEQNKRDFRKAKVMVSLEGTPVEYRAASMLMPYVVDIDQKDGGFYFDNPNIAAVAVDLDKQLQRATMQGLAGPELEGIFKKIGNALKKAVTAPVKAVVNVTKSAVQATTNAVKATANVVKAGVQAATGNADKAKETLQKAGEQAKAAVVQPVKDAVQITTSTVKDTIVEPTVTTIKATGELIKVIFVKINPVTVLMRNALRALVAINFLGIATRLQIGFQSEPDEKVAHTKALAAGYSEEDYQKSRKAVNRVVSFFTKMGGYSANMWTAIVKGSKRKALFKKDYREDQVITDDDELQGLGTLGEAVTIGSCLAAVGAFFVKIWNWVKNIVIKFAQSEAGQTIIKETTQKVVEKVEEKISDKLDEKQKDAVVSDADSGSSTVINNEESSTGESNFKWWILAAAAGLIAVGSSGKKNNRKRK